MPFVSIVSQRFSRRRLLTRQPLLAIGVQMLKPLHSLHEPDDRFRYLSIHDASSGHLRAIRVEDLHAEMRPLELHSSVPNEIRQQFDLARNTYLYSWFAYDLAALAEQHTYVVLEMALKHRAKAEPSKPSGLNSLLELALKRGWLRAEDLEMPGSPTAQPLSFLEVLPKLRNRLVHGDMHLSPDWTLRMMRLSWSAVPRCFAYSSVPGFR